MNNGTQSIVPPAEIPPMTRDISINVTLLPKIMKSQAIWCKVIFSQKIKTLTIYV